MKKPTFFLSLLFTAACGVDARLQETSEELSATSSLNVYTSTLASQATDDWELKVVFEEQVFRITRGTVQLVVTNKQNGSLVSETTLLSDFYPNWANGSALFTDPLHGHATLEAEGHDTHTVSFSVAPDGSIDVWKVLSLNDTTNVVPVLGSNRVVAQDGDGVYLQSENSKTLVWTGFSDEFGTHAHKVLAASLHEDRLMLITEEVMFFRLTTHVLHALVIDVGTQSITQDVPITEVALNTVQNVTFVAQFSAIGEALVYMDHGGPRFSVRKTFAAHMLDTVATQEAPLQVIPAPSSYLFDVGGFSLVMLDGENIHYEKSGKTLVASPGLGRLKTLTLIYGGLFLVGETGVGFKAELECGSPAACR